MGCVTRFICQKLVYLIHVFLCSVSICVVPVLSFVFAWFPRQQKNGGFLKNHGKEKSYLETEPEIETGENITEFGDYDYYVEEEKSEVFLKFKFPSIQEFSEGRGNLFNSEAVPDGSSNSKNDFTSGISFIKETEFLPLKDTNGNGILDISEDEEEDFYDINLEHISTEIGDFHEQNLVVKSESMELTEKRKENNRQSVQEEEEFLGIQDFLDDEKNPAMDSETEVSSDEFLSDGDFGGEQLKNQDELNSDFLSHKDFNEDSDKKYSSEFVTKNQSVKPKPKNPSMPDSGDANKLESLWEHQELIEQLKMELRKVRATGLPTILEESESPKIMDDLKPWKIDEKFQHEDCMDELHKFYKSYRERMRKLDILNYQKMYAIGFLQLKDPLQSISKPAKPSAPTLKSLVSQNFWLFKHKIHGSDPTNKFINELQGDLESVYIGQVCLSWEFLHWQYDKALDLWDSDPRGINQYNEIAGEFQQFQVLMQRFIEDEPFQGPRVQNFVKNRCVLRNLLQVPVIREDSMNSKNRGKKFKDQRDEYTVTSGMLVEIVEESIRIFWQFIQADKDCNITAAINGRKKNMAELHINPADQKLLVEVKKNLQKKERMIKDILRSENCILRRFRRRRQCREDDDSDQVLYFFSQVDMKLVCRVLNMPKISRDQLIWCDNKLNRISFVNRKIQVEPAFLLFPC